MTKSRTGSRTAAAAAGGHSTAAHPGDRPAADTDCSRDRAGAPARESRLARDGRRPNARPRHVLHRIWVVKWASCLICRPGGKTDVGWARCTRARPVLKPDEQWGIGVEGELGGQARSRSVGGEHWVSEAGGHAAGGAFSQSCHRERQTFAPMTSVCSRWRGAAERAGQSRVLSVCRPRSTVAGRHRGKSRGGRVCGR